MQPVMHQVLPLRFRLRGHNHAASDNHVPRAWIQVNPEPCQSQCAKLLYSPLMCHLQHQMRHRLMQWRDRVWIIREQLLRQQLRRR